jgi:hypothetical protein
MEVSGELHAPVALPMEKELPVPIGQEAGWAPEPVGTREKSLAPVGNRTPAVQPVARRYADWTKRYGTSGRAPFVYFRKQVLHLRHYSSSAFSD